MLLFTSNFSRDFSPSKTCYETTGGTGWVVTPSQRGSRVSSEGKTQVRMTAGITTLKIPGLCL